MNKYFIYIALLLNLSVLAQTEGRADSTSTRYATAVQPKNETTGLAKDTLTSKWVQINTEAVQPKKLPINFENSYSGTAFNYDVKTENGFLAQLREWWRNFLDWFKTDSGSSSFVFDEIVNIVLLFLGIVALGFLIYYLNKKGFIRLFSKKETNVISEEFIEENIDQIDFNALTQKAKEVKDYRKAVRYYYLWMLKNWSQNNFIAYEPNKTTKRYVTEIEDQTNKTAFQYVSYIYENIWYGFHHISENDFSKIEAQFIQLINKK